MASWPHVILFWNLVWTSNCMTVFLGRWSSMAERNNNSNLWSCRTINTKLIDVLKSSRWEPVTESPSLKLSPLYVYLQQEESSSISYLTNRTIYFEVSTLSLCLYDCSSAFLDLFQSQDQSSDIPPSAYPRLYCMIIGIHWGKYFIHQLQQINFNSNKFK